MTDQFDDEYSRLKAERETQKSAAAEAQRQHEEDLKKRHEDQQARLQSLMEKLDTKREMLKAEGFQVGLPERVKLGPQPVSVWIAKPRVIIEIEVRPEDYKIELFRPGTPGSNRNPLATETARTEDEVMAALPKHVVRHGAGH